MPATVTESTLSRRETMKLTTRNDAVELKSVTAGTIIPYDAYVMQHIVLDNPKPGEAPEFDSILIKTREDEAGKYTLYATRSETAIESLKSIIQMLAEDGDSDLIDLELIRTKSKNNREFISFALV